MLNKTSLAFRTLFLLAFTRELIKHHSGIEILELENIIKHKKKQELEQKEKHISKNAFQLTSSKIIPQRAIKPQTQELPQILRIPEPRLPARFNYLRPTPTNIDIDLGKLNPLLKDPVVKIIECHGSDKNIYVRTNSLKKTNIVLTKPEIDEIIEIFSKKTKIPAIEGVFKVVVGKTIFSAIVSETIGSKFIIRKMLYNPNLISPANPAPNFPNSNSI